MAITFGGATGWNGASESLRSLRTKAKAANKSTFTPDTPWQPNMNNPEDYNKFRRRANPTNFFEALRGMFPVTGAQPQAIPESYWSGGVGKNIPNPNGLRNEPVYRGSNVPVRSGVNSWNAPQAHYNAGKSWAEYGSQFAPEGGNVPVIDPFFKQLFPKVNLNDVDYDKTATLPVIDQVTGEETAPLPVVEEPTTTPVDAPKWYEGGDIGIFGGPVQPTEWTDPETGQKYRVEVSQRGFGWYPVGFGQLESPDKPDDSKSSGGYDWWNYSGFGGGGGGGYYSAPVSYSNSNWIERLLTNWRINRK